MRKALVLLAIILLIYFVFFSDPICRSLNIGRFESVAGKSEAAVLPNEGPGVYVTYHTTVSLWFGQFTQQESDFFITGSYKCKRGRIEARSSTGSRISGSYDPVTGILQWGGGAYRRLHPTRQFGPPPPPG